jgi:hypothetical protein
VAISIRSGVEKEEFFTTFKIGGARPKCGGRDLGRECGKKIVRDYRSDIAETENHIDCD